MEITLSLSFMNLLFDVLLFIPERLLVLFAFLAALLIAFTVGWIDEEVRARNLTPSFYLSLLWESLVTGQVR